MSSGLMDKMQHLHRQQRSLRRWVVLESVVGVAIVTVAVAAIGWFAAVKFGRPAPALPQPPAVSETVQPPLPVQAAPEPSTPAPPRPVEPLRATVGPPRIEPAPAPASPLSARVGHLDITVDRAVVTRRVLTQFFGIPATEADPALVLEISITNPSASERFTYHSLRGTVTETTARVTVVDDRGMYYPALDYGAVPRGGVETVTLGPGRSVRDVLCFRAVPRDITALDLVFQGARDTAIRIPRRRIVFEDSTIQDIETAAPSAPAPRRQTPVQRPPAPRPTEPQRRPSINPAAVREHEALLRKADAGDPVAQVAVAGNFENGVGTRRDLIRALGYYRMAAEQRHADGEWNIGRVLRDGLGTVSKNDKALRWFRRAAMQGHARAQWAAAEMLRDGDGVKQDLRQAKRWLGELVKNGDRRANQELVAVDPAAYIDSTSRLRLHNTGPSNDPGSAVGAQGRLRDPTGSGWTLVLDNGQTVRVDLTRVAVEHLKDGLRLGAYGILDTEGTIEVLHAVVPEARCVVTSARAVAPQGLMPYRRTRFLAEVVVRNRGPQPIDTVTLSVRVRVLSTPSMPQTATVSNLLPGESRAVRLEFSMFTPETVSAPACDVVSMDLAW